MPDSVNFGPSGFRIHCVSFPAMKCAKFGIKATLWATVCDLNAPLLTDISFLQHQETSGYTSSVNSLLVPFLFDSRSQDQVTFPPLPIEAKDAGMQETICGMEKRLTRTTCYKLVNAKLILSTFNTEF